MTPMMKGLFAGVFTCIVVICINLVLAALLRGVIPEYALMGIHFLVGVTVGGVFFFVALRRENARR